MNEELEKAEVRRTLEEEEREFLIWEARQDKLNEEQSEHEEHEKESDE